MAVKPYERMRAFIVTPFEKKPDAEGRIIDFDAVRTQLIEPALERLGLTGRTTGEIVKAGTIHADMFQRLLTADLVVAEVSIHNANVFYELGIRHALRPHRTFMLRGRGDTYPFDLETYRYLLYDRDKPAASLDALVTALKATLDSTDHDSPVFRSLPGLREQEHSHFLPVPVDFREEVDVAQALKRRGDLNLLAMETQGFQWGEEGLRVVGQAQFKLTDYTGARETWEKIRDDDPDDKEACILLSSIYQRLGDLTRSDQVLKRVLTHPDTTPYERAEAYTLMGRNAKARWIAEWESAEGRPKKALQSRYLGESFELCQKGFGEDLNHFYSGLNALAMLKVRIDLAAELPDVWSEGFEEEAKATAELASLNRQFGNLAPSVALSIAACKERLKREIEATQDSGQRDRKTDELRWALIGEADHSFLTSKRPNLVKSAYRSALTGVADFYSDAAGRQLVLYQSLGILAENVTAALEVAQPKPQPAKPALPQVLVFTGHRIDDPDREAKGLGKRFPRNMETTARDAIKEAVGKELERVGGKAIGIAGGASGGDILFHEVCAELNVPTFLYLALPREQYVVASVQSAGPDWVLRFNTLHDARPPVVLSRSAELPRWLREKEGYNIWQRSNLWILSNALDEARGGSHLTLIALWNGKTGDAAGGTEDMVLQAQKRGARTIILPTEKLFGLDRA
jgi:tetratricopeptide (TPR) repeat protein